MIENNALFSEVTAEESAMVAGGVDAQANYTGFNRRTTALFGATASGPDGSTSASAATNENINTFGQEAVVLAAPEVPVLSVVPFPAFTP